MLCRHMTERKREGERGEEREREEGREGGRDRVSAGALWCLLMMGLYSHHKGAILTNPSKHNYHPKVSSPNIFIMRVRPST